MVTDPKPQQQNRNVKPTSFYLTPDQLRKLDTLAYQHNENSGQRIDRQDIIRHLIDRCSLEDLADLRDFQLSQ